MAAKDVDSVNNYDPFDAIRNGLWHTAGHTDPIKAAIQALHANFDPEKILPILKSKSPGISATGLMILSETGPKASSIIADVLELADHPSWDARFYVADILLACVEALGATDLAKAVLLEADENVEVRCKLMEVLSFSDRKVLRSSIAQIDDFLLRKQSKEGLYVLVDAPTCDSALMALRNSKSPVVRCYAGARAILDARRSAFQGELDAGIDTSELEYIRWRLSQISKERKL